MSMKFILVLWVLNVQWGQANGPRRKIIRRRRRGPQQQGQGRNGVTNMVLSEDLLNRSKMALANESSTVPKSWKKLEGNTLNKRSCTTEKDNLLWAGDWIPRTNSMKIPPCCSGDNVKIWKKNYCQHAVKLFPSGLEQHQSDDLYVHLQGHACECSEPERYKFDTIWTPRSCAIHEWEAKLFCNFLGNRTVLIIGDSVFQQSYGALVNMIIMGKGGCQEQIYYGISDTLIGKNFGGGNDRGKPWLDYVHALRPSIVIFGAGPHVFGRANFATILKSVAKGIQSLITNAQNNNDSIPLFFWKSQQPGGCGRRLDPRNFDVFPRKEHWFNWNIFPEYDDTAINFFQQFSADATVSIIDLRMLYWRTDAKNGGPTKNKGFDCLHICMKTAALYSTFPRMFMHSLALRDPERANSMFSSFSSIHSSSLKFAYNDSFSSALHQASVEDSEVLDLDLDEDSSSLSSQKNYTYYTSSN